MVVIDGYPFRVFSDEENAQRLSRRPVVIPEKTVDHVPSDQSMEEWMATGGLGYEEFEEVSDIIRGLIIEDAIAAGHEVHVLIQILLHKRVYFSS